MASCPSPSACAQAENPVNLSCPVAKGARISTKEGTEATEAVFLGAPLGADGRRHTKAAAEDLQGLQPADCDSEGGQGNDQMTAATDVLAAEPGITHAGGTAKYNRGEAAAQSSPPPKMRNNGTTDAISLNHDAGNHHGSEARMCEADGHKGVAELLAGSLLPILQAS